MRTFRQAVCFTIAIAITASFEAPAQQPSSSNRSVRRSERVARASWQPVRPQRSAAADGAPRHADSQLRRVDHHVESVPVPPPDTVTLPPGSMAPNAALNPPSIVDPPIRSAPLDGQVYLAPVSDGVACDALPAGQCGCDDALCMGGCDTGCCGVSGCSTCGELVSPAAWRPCVTLCLPQDGWVSFEYLGWWQDGMDLPPLVTTSTDPNVPRAEAGVLTSPSTRILFGGNDILDDNFNGGRLRFGVWLDRCHTWAIGAEYFELDRESESFLASSTGDPVLARPFFNTESGVEDAELVAFPNVLTGTVGVLADSELVGAAFHLKYLRCCDEGCSRWLFCGCPEHFCSRTEAMLGYRYLQLDESVSMTENLVSTDTLNPGSFDILDRFQTRNQFNGFDFGWLYRRTRGYWTFDSMIRLGVGNTRQTVTINGQTTVNDPSSTPQVQTLPGGLLTQTSNIGVYRQNQFTVVPEFNANVGYQLTDHLRMTLGYTFIYWSNVVRPGQHISRDVNPNLLPPPADPLTGALRPAFAFDTTDYWVQGISFGGEYRW